MDRIFADVEDDITVAHGPTNALVDGVLLAKCKRHELMARRGAFESVPTADEQPDDSLVAQVVREGFMRLHW